MLALTVRPGKPDSLRVDNVPDPVPEPGQLLIEGLALGICGTDADIVSGLHAQPPPGRDTMVLGHEALGRVVSAPDGAGFGPGDLVAPVVRRPDPVPCGACARGEFDMCRNGRYRERGIKELDGYGSHYWLVEPEYAVLVAPELAETGVLVEPASVVAKAWEQIERVGARSWFEPRRVLVVGAGPIGLLAALFGVQRGLDVHVVDLVRTGAKPELTRALGATYHTEELSQVTADCEPDVVIEATGSHATVADAMAGTAAYGITCLTGVSASGRTMDLDMGTLNRTIVLENDVIIGSVNANLRHFREATLALRRADPAWLAAVITRRLPLERAAEAFDDSGGDGVKTVIDLDR
ncbi:glucose 1-dehydrogenase [Nocardia donostiensis]|uniref:Theronine dehydrogenase n=1 Tax=Nocardia donostiensis TaxID=1538463 RepID=A0A1W0B060_9NOCA|nr:glucose 1-dehydrogenase [Nocardia donostiensis]ONM50208.1 theronine dehydrogenase [Nocardia donostiensis]OQS15869.1 theronine dehydrogenase [Nocardia donostiensis]OQS23676.1 theronine dehydrogenase [Nocardia donostiensis]